jgi:Bacterial SH3 domain
MEKAIELKLKRRVVELGEDTIVSIPDALEANPRVPDLTQQKAKTRAMTIAMIGILTMPLFGLMAGDEKLWETLQSLVETERPAKSQSTVLAVDTAALSVRSKSASSTTKEIFEQAAMEHLARLHHTFNSWSERNQELMGSVSLKLLVDSSGNVVRVEPMNSHVNNSSFIKTVMDDVREWKFPNGGTEAAEITVPLLFIPKGMDPEMIVQWERSLRSGRVEERPAKSLAVATALPTITDRNKFAARAPTILAKDRQKTVAAALSAPAIARKPSTIAKAAAAPIPNPAAKPLPVVKTNRQLAIRDKPRYAASSLREVEKETPLKILENRGDWLKVRAPQDGVTGFIRKEYVSPING